MIFYFKKKVRPLYPDIQSMTPVKCVNFEDPKQQFNKTFEQIRKMNNAKMNNLVELWSKCLHIIKDNLNETSYNTWFKPIVPISLEESVLVLQVPSPFFVEFIEEKFIDILSKTLTKVMGKGTKLEYRVLIDKTYNQGTQYPSKGEPQQKANTPAIRSPYEQIALPPIDPQLKPTHTFENLVEGKSNKLARSAGLAIAEHPGKTAFNPCFIYGKSGVGKTHLANAIGVAIKNKYPEKRVLYVRANTFQIQYTDAVRNNAQNDFLNFYQTIDVLILDDIHEFSGKKGTQNTFFHIFNHLHQLDKQLILTCDRPPAELKGMEDRLLTRFKWRLTALMEVPDFEMRKQILQNIIKRDGLTTISQEVVDYIAKNVTDNIRDLEGTLGSLSAHSIIENKHIDIEFAREIIGRVTPQKEKKALSIEEIRDKTCEKFNLTVDKILTQSRQREVVEARQTAMFLSKKLTKAPLSSIGKAIGGRNHSTVVYACKRVEDLIETDKQYKKIVEEIEAMLK